jgi:lysophospholipase L1-like esterase
LTSNTDVIAYGDSKTASNVYQPIMRTNLIYADALYTTITTLAAGLRTAASGAAAIDAEIAGCSANPRIVLFNLGVNDAGALDETAWKANINYILAAIHTKWSDAVVYMMRVWLRDYDGACNTIDGWIDDLIATHDYCRTGPDERVFLENGDDGATYTSDGIHPNDAGYALTATQWQTAIGY